jgi:hypothetical protein
VVKEATTSTIADLQMPGVEQVMTLAKDLKAKTSTQVTKDKKGPAAITTKVVEDLTKVEMALMTSMAAI